MKLLNLCLVVVCCFVLSSCLFESDSGDSASGPRVVVEGAPVSATPPANAETFTIGVDGMSCGIACPPKIEEALLALPGVSNVEVDFESKTATVTAEKGKVNAQQLVTTLEAKTEFKGAIQ